MKRELFWLGGIGVGAGLMYWLDPDRGRHRRARTRAQLSSARHRVEDLMADATPELPNLHLPRRYRAHFTSPFRRQRQRAVPDAVLLALGAVGLSTVLAWMARSRYTSSRADKAASGSPFQSVCDWAWGVWDSVGSWCRPQVKAPNANANRPQEREHEVTMMGAEAESTKEAERQ